MWAIYEGFQKAELLKLELIIKYNNYLKDYNNVPLNHFEREFEAILFKRLFLEQFLGDGWKGNYQDFSYVPYT